MIFLEENKTLEYSYPIFGAAPQGAKLPDIGAGRPAYLHREKTITRIMDPNGEQLSNYPETENAASQIEQVDPFILAGYLLSDGRFEAKDIFRYGDEELIEMPEARRKEYLEKFKWNDLIIPGYKEKLNYKLEEFLNGLKKEDFPIKTKVVSRIKESPDIKLEDFLNRVKQEDFPITVKEV